MTATQELALPDASLSGDAAQMTPAEELLFSLEGRHAALCAELAELEERLRVLRTAAEVCEHCGGAGERWVRGGLYGELRRKACVCQEGEL